MSPGVAEHNTRRGVVLRVVVESPPREKGCPACGVLAHSHVRRMVRLVDVPCFGRPVELAWRKRTWRCAGVCGRGIHEQHDDVAKPRALLATRACWWAIGQLRREHASVQGLAWQLGTTWRTVWTSIKPLLDELADDESRFDGVTNLGVDEHAPRVHPARRAGRTRHEGTDRDGRPVPRRLRSHLGTAARPPSLAGPARPMPTGSGPGTRSSAPA
jgi:hypothetical protein